MGRRTAKESYNYRMVTFMKVITRMIFQMATVFLLHQAEKNTRANGATMPIMVKEKRLGLMVANLLGNLFRAKKMALESTSGLMARSIQANGLTAR